jgi:hypothetical protein
MRDDGHTIGVHCHEHVRHSERDLPWLRDDTRAALDELRRGRRQSPTNTSCD